MRLEMGKDKVDTSDIDTRYKHDACDEIDELAFFIIKIDQYRTNGSKNDP